MHKTRLLKLAEHLYTVPAEKFDLLYWTCGTASCAVGHAASIPEFKKAGFRLRRAPWSGNLGDPAPEFEDDRGWDAVIRFFDIDHTTALHLFYHDSYRKYVQPNEVAMRIEKIVSEAP